jgi:hypothetical protein
MDEKQLEKKLMQADSDISTIVSHLIRDEKDLILVGAVLLKYALTTYSATLLKEDVQQILDTAMDEYDKVACNDECFSDLSSTIH